MVSGKYLSMFPHRRIPPFPALLLLPVGFSAGVKGAQHRIANLVRGKKVLEGQVIIGLEEMVSELLPGK